MLSSLEEAGDGDLFFLFVPLAAFRSRAGAAVIMGTLASAACCAMAAPALRAAGRCDCKRRAGVAGTTAGVETPLAGFLRPDIAWI